MKKIIKANTGSIAFRNGGGVFMTIFGFPFLLGGLFTMFSWLGVFGNQNADITVVIIGLPFFLVGLGLIFGRSGLIIDHGTRSLTTW